LEGLGGTGIEGVGLGQDQREVRGIRQRAARESVGELITPGDDRCGQATDGSDEAGGHGLRHHRRRLVAGGAPDADDLDIAARRRGSRGQLGLYRGGHGRDAAQNRDVLDLQGL
jgi:hypothetical protein